MAFRVEIAPQAFKDIDAIAAYIGKYKIYFAIHGKTIRILHVRHWAREPLAADELQRLMDDLR